MLEKVSLARTNGALANAIAVSPTADATTEHQPTIGKTLLLESISAALSGCATVVVYIHHSLNQPIRCQRFVSPFEKFLRSVVAGVFVSLCLFKLASPGST